MDHFTRESLAIETGQGKRGRDVVDVLEYLSCDRNLPKSIRVDNDPELNSKVLDQWVYANRVTLDFSRRGEPMDNAFNENAPAECLNES